MKILILPARRFRDVSDLYALRLIEQGAAVPVPTKRKGKAKENRNAEGQDKRG